MKKLFFKHDPLVTIAVLFVLFFGAPVVASLLLAFYPALRSWTETQSIVWMKEAVAAQFLFVFLWGAVVVAAVLRLLKWIGVRTQRIGLVKPQLRDVGYALIGYGLYFLASFFVRLAASPFLTEQEQQIGFENAYAFSELAMAFVALVIIPPVTEEILFRGFLFTSLRAKYKFLTTSLITSALFGIAHLQFGSEAPLLWAAAIDTFVLSYFLCELRERTGSLWSPMLLHAVKNGMAFLIIFGPRFI